MPVQLFRWEDTPVQQEPDQDQPPLLEQHHEMTPQREKEQHMPVQLFRWEDTPVQQEPDQDQPPLLEQHHEMTPQREKSWEPGQTSGQNQQATQKRGRPCKEQQQPVNTKHPHQPLSLQLRGRMHEPPLLRPQRTRRPNHRYIQNATSDQSDILAEAIEDEQLNACLETSQEENFGVSTSLVKRNLHIQPYHPLSFIRQNIVSFLYKKFVGRTGNPIFSVYDNLSPVVSVEQNFDSLITPATHPSRGKSDCYYINHKYLLRGHTTAHQSELINMGLNNFLVVGDVYRRDEIDTSHYPVFHQADAVRICTQEEVISRRFPTPVPWARVAALKISTDVLAHVVPKRAE
uniref:Phenylalanyl-tRNA synthetase domain-containing protein n=1 Tax=Timema genevievae TaxID=629358 RepID=A0A7R9JU07_TIMGE|nr:unnamed protein product [Timema genevievae]